MVSMRRSRAHRTAARAEPGVGSWLQVLPKRIQDLRDHIGCDIAGPFHVAAAPEADQVLGGVDPPAIVLKLLGWQRDRGAMVLDKAAPRTSFADI